jgi:hypothetical protein
MKTNKQTKPIKGFFLRNCVFSYMYVHIGLCACVFRYERRPEGGVSSSGAGLRLCDCEPPHMGAGDLDRLFCKCNKCSSLWDVEENIKQPSDVSTDGISKRIAFQINKREYESQFFSGFRIYTI